MDGELQGTAMAPSSPLTVLAPVWCGVVVLFAMSGGWPHLGEWKTSNVSIIPFVCVRGCHAIEIMLQWLWSVYWAISEEPELMMLVKC